MKILVAISYLNCQESLNFLNNLKFKINFEQICQYYILNFFIFLKHLIYILLLMLNSSDLYGLLFSYYYSIFKSLYINYYLFSQISYNFIFIIMLFALLMNLIFKVVFYNLLILVSLLYFLQFILVNFELKYYFYCYFLHFIHFHLFKPFSMFIYFYYFLSIFYYSQNSINFN